MTMIRLIQRNSKLYFKDKSTFFMSMISPMILFVLFVTFLGSVYKNSFLSIIQGFSVDSAVVDAFTVCWLMSSILGVSSVTVAFCSNVIMAQDKINGSRGDILSAPVKKSTLAVSYYAANVITTGIVCLTAAGLGFAYIATIGWYFSAADILYIILDIILCVLFGTALAALAENFINTQGGIGVVSSLVSALYGFVCGAYMPISQFSEPIRNLISFMPGTYGTVLLKGHYMDGVLNEVAKTVPDELVSALRDGFDANMYFFGNKVEKWQMYAVLAGAIFVLLGIYVLINRISGRKKG